MPPPSPLRVLSIGMGWLPEQPGNGLDRVFHSLMQTLPAAGLDTRGLVVGSDDVATDSDGRVQAFAPGTDSLFARLQAVRRAVRAEIEAGLDVLASHFALYTVSSLDILGDVPLVVHFHGPWALESDAEGEGGVKVRAKKALESMVYRRADRAIVLSEAFRDVLHTRYGVPLDRIRIVPGGADVDRFAVDASRRAARERLGWPTDRPTLLSVRRLARRMGLENLVDAVGRLRNEVPNVRLYIAGTGPRAEVLQARIDDAGLSDAVQLLGFVPDEDLPYAYRAADVSVVPTVALEGFGLITIESLAAGTPVLVTPVGGLPETVRGLSERLILPDAKVDTLTAHLTDALTHPDRLPTSDACRTYARTHFSWQAIARKTRAVYEEAAAMPAAS